jgi:hypothetical protein
MCKFSSIVYRENSVSNKLSPLIIVRALHCKNTHITQSYLLAQKKSKMLTRAFLKLRNGNIPWEGEIRCFDKWGRHE